MYPLLIGEATRGDTGKAQGKTKFIILRGPRDRRRSTPCRATGKAPGGQQAEDRNERRALGPQSLLGVPRETQGRVNGWQI